MNIELIQKKHNRFSFNIIHMTPDKDTNDVVFIFPGAGYSHLGPLLYYPTQWMLERNKVVIIADYDFRLFEESEDLNRVDVLNFCIKECLLFGQEKYPEGEFSFIGKSIGTQALCLLPTEASKINFNCTKSKIIWLTPVWKREDCLQHMSSIQNKSLYIIGDNDSHYSASAHQKVKNNLNTEIVVINGADHSMDNDLDVEETFKIHRKVFDKICDFLM